MRSIIFTFATQEELISIVAHQLRAPLTAIRGYLWLCVFRPTDQLPTAVSQHLHTAYIATERLLKLVNEFLTTAQLGTGKLVNRSTTCQLTAIIEQVLREVSLQAQKKQLTVVFKNLTTNSSCTVDRTQIAEVLHNLLSNAVKFSPRNGKILVVLSADESAFTISVTDEGPGIAPADQHTLFQKFAVIPDSYQWSETTQHSTQQATGLGLYIAQQFAKLHHGQITVSSKKGKGATFTLRLPRTDVYTEIAFTH